jgi:prepilin-type N-terminal cleavage/methylation domain-containing protein
MSLQTNNNKLQASRGFTIVELLIVIVVIAILAAITIVAYNGITARANTASALASAQSVAKKAELYLAEESTLYPTQAQLTGAGTDKSYYTPASSFSTATFVAKPDNSAGNKATTWYVVVLVQTKRHLPVQQ